MKINLLTLLASIFLVFATFSYSSAQSTKGTIRGSIKDAGNGEELIGATVVIVGTTTGSAADLDGKYSISVEAGTYDLQVSFVSYQSKTITGVEVKAGEVTVIDAVLGEDTAILDAVVVSSKAETASTTAVLAAQKKSGVVQDGLASEQIARSGDRDAAAAITRVTGVSVEGGKYVYVRGLGDRYSKTTLNGANLPSLDPNRNSVQMDLFPSNLIDNIVVSKTFSPELSGEFAGGNVNLVTKDFPDRFTFQWNSSFGFNDQASFNKDFLSYEGGKTDYLGVDDGTREIPSIVADGLSTDREQLAEESKSFGEGFGFENKSPMMNQFHSVAIGNQIDVLGRPFGFVTSLSYQRNFNYFDDGVTGRYNLPSADSEELNPAFDLRSEKGTETVLAGANLNMAYKIAPTSKIALNLMYNRSSDKVADFREGRWSEEVFGENNIYQTNVLQYLERSIGSAQLKGKHTLGKRNIEIEWLSSLAQSTQDEPDLRYFSRDYIQTGEERVYNINIAAYPAPSRYYRDMLETNWDNKVDVTIPFTTKAGDSKIKLGGGYLMKERDFNEQRYDYGRLTGFNVLDDFTRTGDTDDFLKDVGFLESGQRGMTIIDATQLTNSYTGTQEVISAYAMTDWRIAGKLRSVMGLRYEGTNITTTSDNPDVEVGEIETNDILPALNLIYELNDKVNLRASYGRTLARPTFRELAPFPSFDFIGDFILIGNPNLERTLIDNIDLRFESYPALGEIISVSAFYKRFQNPIERAFNPQAANGEVQFRNVDAATVMGLEFEIRKRLNFTKALERFSVGSNLSIMSSKVDIDPRELELIRATDPNRKSTRSMFMQSPYVANAFVYYDIEEKGISVSTTFNVFGKRLAYVTQGGQPDVFEVARPSLDIAFKKTMESGWGFSFRARNLLNPEYKMVQEFKGQEYTYGSYKIGRTFSLGITYLID
ncbi:TonB-dependent receptor domain-containing protein [Bernardetia sp. OM2101]|uniref:TonB-dependent receptor n=1 Tax=Bernardetia sp. OM2101 TaxID=3344876 RepID=UPI0035D03E19